MKKHLFSLLLCVGIAIGVFAAMTATASAETLSGYCGKMGYSGEHKKVMYSLDTETGVLTIGGDGEMKNYGASSGYRAPWYDYRSSINTVIIESGVKSIGEYAFDQNDSLTSVTIGNSVVSIETCAFESCTSLTTIEIPDSVTSLGSRAFFYCTGLTNIMIGNGLVSIGPSAFGECTSLTTIEIPDSVTSIEEDAFNKCTSLKNIEIPNSVTSIGDRAFNKCTDLTSVTIPDSVTSIGGYAFEYTPWLESLGEFAIVNGILIRYQGNWGDVIIPNSVKSIAGDAFDTPYDFPSATITIPDSITSIGDYAFRSCHNLTSITIPNSVTSIGKWAFYGCNNLPSIKIPNSVKSIGSYAFYNCYSLTSVTMGNGTTKIGEYAFFKYTGFKDGYDVYFYGSEEQWNSIDIGRYNEDLLYYSTIHYIQPRPARIVPTVSTTTWTASPRQGTVSVTFDAAAGGNLYKDGKTRTDMRLAWSFDMFNTSALGYSKDLATVAAVLSGNAYTSSLVRETLETLGFSNVYQDRYEIGEQYGWVSNTVGYSIASTTETIGGRQTNVIAIVCRGTAGQFLLSNEWQSNFGKMADGFEDAASDVMCGLDRYVADPKNGIDTKLPTKFFITGHSRGGAVANLLGKAYSGMGEENVFVYTFASPTTTNDENRQKYYNIKNFVNAADVVPTLPGAANAMIYGCNRYGLDCRFDKWKPQAFEACFSELTGGSVCADISSFLQEHSMAIYTAYVMSVDLFGSESRYKPKVLSVHCPVDVAIYDDSGNLLGRIVNNVPDDSLAEQGIFVQVNGDEKEIYPARNGEIRLELTGTDDGVMTYSVQELDEDGTVSTKTFENVALTDGKTMLSVAAEDIAAADTQLFVLQNEAVDAEIDTAGNETAAVLISFETGDGEPIRDMSVIKGSCVGTLPTAKAEGYIFAGWYTDVGCTALFDETVAVNAPIMLYAKYAPAHDVYAQFSNVIYDGTQLSATLRYDYNETPSTLLLALYQNGKLIDARVQSVDSGSDSATITMAESDLLGIYEMKAFALDGVGQYKPVSEYAKTSFYAN